MKTSVVTIWQTGSIINVAMNLQKKVFSSSVFFSWHTVLCRLQKVWFPQLTTNELEDRTWFKIFIRFFFEKMHFWTENRLQYFWHQTMIGEFLHLSNNPLKKRKRKRKFTNSHFFPNWRFCGKILLHYRSLLSLLFAVGFLQLDFERFFLLSPPSFHFCLFSAPRSRLKSWMKEKLFLECVQKAVWYFLANIFRKFALKDLCEGEVRYSSKKIRRGEFRAILWFYTSGILLLFSSSFPQNSHLSVSPFLFPL